MQHGQPVTHFLGGNRASTAGHPSEPSGSPGVELLQSHQIIQHPVLAGQVPPPVGRGFPLESLQ
jgi:hypothetical protein